MRRRVRRLMGGGRIVHFATFTAIDGASVIQQPTDSGAVWTYRSPGSSDPLNALIQSGGAQQATGNQSSHMTLGTKYRRKNCRVEMDVTLIDATANSQAAGLLVRSPVNNIPGGPRLSYEFRHLQSGTPQWNVVANGVTIVATNNQTLTLNQTYRAAFEVRGPVLIAYVDGALLRKIDSSLVNKRASIGFRLTNNANAAPSHRIDNWMVTR